MAFLPLLLLLFMLLLPGSSSQGRNCKTFYFQAKIYVKDIAHCSDRERRRLGAFLNRVINDAFANINIVTLNAKVCSTPQSSYGDDDGYYYDDDNSTRRILEDEDVFLENNNHWETTMIQPNQEDPAAEQRWLRFGDFHYIGGGSCRFCLRDDWDARKRRILGRISTSSWSNNGASSASASVRNGSSRAHAHSNRGVSSSGTGGYSSTSSVANDNGHAFSFTTSFAWTNSLERQLEESLSNYLTRVVKERYRRGCLRRRTPKISVDLTRTKRRNARPDCFSY